MRRGPESGVVAPTPLHLLVDTLLKFLRMRVPIKGRENGTRSSEESIGAVAQGWPKMLLIFCRLPCLRDPLVSDLRAIQFPLTLSRAPGNRMDFGPHFEAPYVYTFLAGLVTALWRPTTPPLPVVAACNCQCDCTGTNQWSVRALLALGACVLLLVQALAFGGYQLVSRTLRARRAVRAPTPKPSSSSRPRTLPPAH